MWSCIARLLVSCLEFCLSDLSNKDVLKPELKKTERTAKVLRPPMLVHHIGPHFLQWVKNKSENIFFCVRWFSGNMIGSICIDICKLKRSNVILSSYLIYSFGLGYPSGPSPPTLVLYLDMILLIICKKSFNSNYLSYLWCFLLMENYCSDDHWPSSMLYAPWAQQTFDNKH